MFNSLGAAVRVLGVFVCAQAAICLPSAAAGASDKFKALEARFAEEIAKIESATKEKESKLLKQYQTALKRMLEHPEIKRSPAAVAMVQEELVELSLSESGSQAAEKSVEEPPDDFVFPTTDGEWQAVGGLVVTIAMDDLELRWGKPSGIKVRKGEKYRVVPHPADPIGRSKPDGNWKGVGDRAWLGVLIPGQTRTRSLAGLERSDFVYTALADGDLAFRVYMWEAKGFGKLRIKVRKLGGVDLEDDPEGEPARIPSKLAELHKILERGKASIETDAAREIGTMQTRYLTALKSLLPAARSERLETLVVEIEGAIAKYSESEASENKGLEVSAALPFEIPETGDDWEKLPGKEIKIEAADKQWRVPRTVASGVSRGERFRLIPHPADIWGREIRTLSQWHNGDRCNLKIGIRGKTEMEIVDKGFLGETCLYQAKEDGALCLQTYVWSGGIGFTRWKLQKLVD